MHKPRIALRLQNCKKAIPFWQKKNNYMQAKKKLLSFKSIKINRQIFDTVKSENVTFYFSKLNLNLQVRKKFQKLIDGILTFRVDSASISCTISGKVDVTMITPSSAPGVFDS